MFIFKQTNNKLTLFSVYLYKKNKFYSMYNITKFKKNKGVTT